MSSVTRSDGSNPDLISNSPSAYRVPPIVTTTPNPSIQNPNDGIKKLAIHLPDIKQATIAVLFVPELAEGIPAEISTNLSPLVGWKLTDD